jgi:hypothetical protein
MPKIAVAILLCLCVHPENLGQTAAPGGTETKISRDAFAVRFDFAGKRVEQKFETTPYVDGKTIAIFPGEEFGISVRHDGNEISEIRYEADLKKANIRLRLEVQDLGSRAMMMLTTTNGLDKSLAMEGWMLLPARGEPVKTSLLPVMPGLMGIESWPHPIVKLELRNLHLADPPKEFKGPKH